MKLLIYIHCCYKFLFASSYTSTYCFYWKSKVLRSSNINCYLQNSVFLLSCSGQVHLSKSLLYLIKPLGLSDQCDLWEGKNFSWYHYLCLLKPPGHRGRLPWVFTFKEKEVSYLGDSDRTTSCYPNLLFTCLWLLGKYKLCDNNNNTHSSTTTLVTLFIALCCCYNSLNTCHSH